MLNLKIKTLIILPHIDDEFALTPLIKKMNIYSQNNIKFVYCSERRSSSKKDQIKRRRDNIRSLNLLGININQVIYLNDFFNVEDNLLHKSSSEVYRFLKGIIYEEYFPQVFTLNYEGGHPDHDQIAIIVNKLKSLFHFNAFYFPAYNSRFTLFLPFSVLRPLKSQENSFKYIEFENFCWILSLRISLFYSTERFAFLMLTPTLIYKAIFSKRLIYFDHINLSSVNWSNSLSFKRYNVAYQEINKFINSRE